MAHLTLSGRNGHRSTRTVYVDDVKIGVVSPSADGLWKARDNQGRNHGDSYTTDFNAAKQLALGLRVRTSNPARGTGTSSYTVYPSKGSPKTFGYLKSARAWAQEAANRDGVSAIIYGAGRKTWHVAPKRTSNPARTSIKHWCPSCLVRMRSSDGRIYRCTHKKNCKHVGKDWDDRTATWIQRNPARTAIPTRFVNARVRRLPGGRLHIEIQTPARKRKRARTQGRRR